QIACQAGPVIPVAAPTEEARRIEGALWRAIEPSVPIDGLLAGVRRNRIHPGAAVAIPVPRRLDGVHLPQLAGIPDLLRFGIENRTHALAADLTDAVVLLDSLDHGQPVLHTVGHGFFAVDVLPCLDRLRHRLAMPMVRSGDNYGINILAIQNPPVITCGFDVLSSQSFFGGDMPGVV